MLDQNKRKAKLTALEKAAISIIVILIIVILLLIFNKQIKEYIEIFRTWYESA